MMKKIITKDNGIQLLRVISCLAIFFCHFGQRIELDKISTNLYNFTQLGGYGIGLFFVISGYLVCFSLQKEKSVTKFYKKKAIRILPLYFFSILYFFITETFIFKSVPIDPLNLGWLRYIFCLNAIIPSEGYFWSNIGITWTIPVFVIFYILAPFLVKFAKTTLKSTIVLVVSIIIALIISKFGNCWFMAFKYIPCFLMGIVIYNSKIEKRLFITLLVFQLFIFIIKFGDWNYYLAKFVPLLELFVVSSIFASVLLLSHEFKVKNKKAIKLLNFLDEHSYTLYLVHGITFCGFIDKLSVDSFGNYTIFIIFKFIIAFAITGVLIILIHKYIEKPVQNMLTKKFIR